MTPVAKQALAANPADARFWSFDVADDNVEAVPPTRGAVEAVGLMLSYSSHEGHRDARILKTIWLIRSIVPEALSIYLSHWVASTYGPGRALSTHQEAGAMSVNANAIARDRRSEEFVKKIISNPDLAEMAFPSQELREKVYPLLVSTRELAEKHQSSE